MAVVAVLVNQTCHENENQFFCVHDGRCIAAVFVCDGDPDCSDGADERYDMCKSTSACFSFDDVLILVEVLKMRLFQHTSKRQSKVRVRVVK